jgi:hypothetical protein
MALNPKASSAANANRLRQKDEMLVFLLHMISSGSPIELPVSLGLPTHLPRHSGDFIRFSTLLRLFAPNLVRQHALVAIAGAFYTLSSLQ